MTFLCDEWLCDVATDHTGKATIVAAALTLIERSLLDQRPVFFISAGKAGGGKTTTMTMLIAAVTGNMPAAAAWSSNEEERRKTLLSYFMFGVPYILWDNIPRGSQIACPHIEKSCTSAYYADRKLGVSEIVAIRRVHDSPVHRQQHRSRVVTWLRAPCISGSMLIASILKTGRSSIPIRSAGRRNTAAKSLLRSTPSCWGTRSSRRRAMRRKDKV